ncbi:MAG: YraN family protein [Oscillospiraceae bacterium]|jgi:putative endonuclease|nr:YraN family protein [Oscillospiraceae bacterium]
MMDKAARRNAREFGRRAEEQTAAWLETRGYRILERNYRTRVSEADIVALSGGTLAFIEVKARSGSAYGLPCEAVTPRKQAKVAHAAQSWLYAHDMLDAPVRFDVIEVYPGRIRHIRNAFEAPAAA